MKKQVGAENYGSTQIEGVLWYYQILPEEANSEESAACVEIAGCADKHMKKVEVPAVIESLPVHSIAPYAWSECRQLETITLPDDVERIGGHCFYNCRKLKSVSLSDKIHIVEDGAFKNCEELTEVTMRRLTGRSTCLRSMMNEINTDLECILAYEDFRVKLFFPGYVYDYEANVEARIINQITYGTGVHYRECISGGEDVDYQAYDRVFEMAVHNEKEEKLCHIARNRLLYPYRLSEEAKKRYEGYLQEHIVSEVDRLIEAEDMACLQALGENGLYQGKDKEAVLALAHKKGNVSCTAAIMKSLQRESESYENRFAL